MIGTIAYMSPEQAAGRRVQPPSDVYSAGMVLYELLAGAHPLRGDTPAETLSNVAAARLPSLAALRPDLPDELVTLIDAPARRARPSGRRRRPQRGASTTCCAAAACTARRLQRAQRLVRPLGRAGEVAERAGGAALAAVTSAVVLGALPAYPQSWTLPLVARHAPPSGRSCPQAGLAFLLGSLAFPRVQRLAQPGRRLPRLRRRAVPARARAGPSSALWPAFALRAHAGLPHAAGAGGGGAAGPRARPAHRRLGRRRHRSSSCCSRARRAARSRSSSRAGASGARPRRGRRPVHRRRPRARARAGAAPTLLQAAVWAGLAAALGYALTRRRLETRLWIWSLSFAAVFARVPHRAGRRLGLPGEPVAARLECGRCPPP